MAGARISRRRTRPLAISGISTSPASIVYTSGTESLPKGAMLTHDAVIWQYVSCVVDAGIAAARPRFLTRDEVPAETIETERRVAEQTAKEEGKPEQAIAKIVEGRLGGFFKEIVLEDQPFAKDPKQTVGKVASDAGTKVTGFARFRVGN